MTRLAALAAVSAAGSALAVVLDRLVAPPPRPVDSLVVVDAPPEEVWRHLADVERQPEWMTDLKSVRIDSPGPVGAGTRATGRVRILGVGVPDPVTITAFEAPTRFAVRHDGRFGGEGVITLEPGADGTTTIVRWSETLVPPVLPRLGAAVLRPILGHVFQADLHRLRRLVET